VLVNLDPAMPHEAAKTRPCIVVSNDGSNKAVERLRRGTITIVTVTSNTASLRANFQVVVESDESLHAMGLSRPSKVQAEQVRTVSVQRVGETIGWTPASVMRELDSALRFHLSL
jgi:mRNA interferase MazF